MTLIKRLATLSVDELETVQAAILDEIQRRDELAGVAATMTDDSVVTGKNPGKAGRIAVSKPTPAAAPPVPLRRAA
jgi:hypothetical protein